MGLTALNLNCNVQWAESKSNTGFAATTFGPASQFFNLSGVDVSSVNQVASLRYTNLLAAAGEDPAPVTTLDLRTLTNKVGESFSLGHVLGIMVLPVGTGSELTFGPGASNGLQWIFGTDSTLVVKPGSGFCYSEAPTSTGTVVDSTHKTIDFTNSGTSTMTSLTVVIWGKTT